jgi:hypothetical protein
VTSTGVMLKESHHERHCAEIAHMATQRRWNERTD